MAHLSKPTPSLCCGIGAACPVTAMAGRIADATGAPVGGRAWTDVFYAAFKELSPLFEGINDGAPGPRA